MTDQDRAEAFLKRLTKSVTPNETQVWKPGIQRVPETRKQHVINAAAKQRKEQLEASALGERGHATVHPHGQHPRVLREVHYAPRGNAVNGRAVARRISEPATRPERLQILVHNEARRAARLGSLDPSDAARIQQAQLEYHIPSPRHFYVGNGGYRGRG